MIIIQPFEKSETVAQDLLIDESCVETEAERSYGELVFERVLQFDLLSGEHTCFVVDKHESDSVVVFEKSERTVDSEEIAVGSVLHSHPLGSVESYRIDFAVGVQ